MSLIILASFSVSLNLDARFENEAPSPQFSLLVLVIIPLRLAKHEAIHLRKNVLPWFIPVPVPTGTKRGQVLISFVSELVSVVVTGGFGEMQVRKG